MRFPIITAILASLTLLFAGSESVFASVIQPSELIDISTRPALAAEPEASESSPADEVAVVPQAKHWWELAGVYRLAEGPHNQCPDKLGVVVAKEASELRVYPMEFEWTAPRTQGISPLLDAERISESAAAPKETEIKSLKAKFLVTATWRSPKLETVRVYKPQSGPTVETHASLEVDDGELSLTRWSLIENTPLTQPVRCDYGPSNSFHDDPSLATLIGNQ